MFMAVVAGGAAAQPVDERAYFNNLDAVHAAGIVARSAGPKLPAPLMELRRQAEKALKEGPYTVTKKEMVPSSGDRHDYMSLSPYWWPDPTKPDGKPYVRRDGEVNPEREKIPDRDQLRRLALATENLSLAYAVFADERYAEKASALLKAWFLDPSTRMNPNMRFAQAVIGRSEGRGVGLVEARHFLRIIEGVDLLEGSPAWAKEESGEIRAWIRTFLQWMQESPNGKEERDAPNNHGTWYQVQVVRYAMATGVDSLARAALAERGRERIASTVEPDGSQPRELARTDSWGYSLFNLEALMALATLGERAGVDLWNYATADGRSIRKALDYLLPFAEGKTAWTYQTIRGKSNDRLVPLLLMASRVWKDPRYAALAREFAGPEWERGRYRITVVPLTD
jgi:hypothetical protein